MKKRNIIRVISIIAASLLLASCENKEKSPVDYVNPYIGGISHMLVPCYQYVHLPNSMMRVYPMRESYTDVQINGLPVILTNDRGAFAFHFNPSCGDIKPLAPVMKYTYDNEEVTPYKYRVRLDEVGVDVDYAPSHQSAIYDFEYDEGGARFVISTDNGELHAEGRAVSGFQNVDGQTKVYLFAEFDKEPEATGVLTDGRIDVAETSVSGLDAAIGLSFGGDVRKLSLRYGMSFISKEQARKNLEREIPDFNLEAVAEKGRDLWNGALSQIEVSGGTEDEKTVFYTALYRTMQRPVNMSEDGRYYSGFDHAVHEDGGRPFYTDDWIWDTYRTTHPLRVLLDTTVESDMLNSYLLMAKQMASGWMPTFPGTTGPRWWMNCNHAVASMLDAYRKGIRGFSLADAFTASQKAIEEKSLLPWNGGPAGPLSRFYKEHGYFPSLKKDQEEYLPNISAWEQRQPVAVTLGTSYDEWCLSQVAEELGDTANARRYLQHSYNYRNLFNPASKFFHPKDSLGNFVEGVSYKYVGRRYYSENNGYIHRWDIQHNIGDLVNLIGGRDSFITALDSMFSTPLGMARFDFYNLMPDHGANVGMFSMANEPCFHIPYLYNYAGTPWKTQKMVRTLIDEWFRNDLMGVPGDEDGGGMSAFVVFSMMGFYPVTPGHPSYNVGTPFFKDVKIHLDGGNIFEIKAPNASKENKYIQSATLNGRPLGKCWFSHSDVVNGGKLEFEMGPRPNKSWGVGIPPFSQDTIM